MDGTVVTICGISSTSYSTTFYIVKLPTEAQVDWTHISLIDVCLDFEEIEECVDGEGDEDEVPLPTEENLDDVIEMLEAIKFVYSKNVPYNDEFDDLLENTIEALEQKIVDGEYEQ